MDDATGSRRYDDPDLHPTAVTPTPAYGSAGGTSGPAGGRAPPTGGCAGGPSCAGGPPRVGGPACRSPPPRSAACYSAGSSPVWSSAARRAIRSPRSRRPPPRLRCPDPAGRGCARRPRPPAARPDPASRLLRRCSPVVWLRLRRSSSREAWRRPRRVRRPPWPRRRTVPASTTGTSAGQAPTDVPVVGRQAAGIIPFGSITYFFAAPRSNSW